MSKSSIDTINGQQLWLQGAWVVIAKFQLAVLELLRTIQSKRLGDAPPIMQQQLLASCLLFVTAVQKKQHSHRPVCLRLPACHIMSTVDHAVMPLAATLGSCTLYVIKQAVATPVWAWHLLAQQAAQCAA